MCVVSLSEVGWGGREEREGKECVCVCSAEGQLF